MRHLRWMLFRFVALQLSATRIVPRARRRQASRLAGVADLDVELAVSGLSHGAIYAGSPAVFHRNASYVSCRCHTPARREVDGAWAAMEPLRVGPCSRWSGHRNWTSWIIPK